MAVGRAPDAAGGIVPPAPPADSLGRPRTRAPGWALLAAAVWTLAIALRVHNAVTFPLDGSSDERIGHLDYIQYVRTEWRQPPPRRNLETWQPPLYYWTMAAAWAASARWSPRPFDLWAPPQRAVLPLLSSAMGLAAAALAWRVVRRVVPDDPLAELLALAVVLFAPMHVIVAPWLRSDLLAVLLAAAVVALLAAQDDLTALPATARVGLGVLLGLGLLAKYTGTSAIATVALCLGAATVTRPGRARAVAVAAVPIFGLAAAIGGWFYVRHWLLEGKLFWTALDWLGTFGQPPGARGAADFLSFPAAVFLRPWVIDASLVRSVWAGTYATAWFDGQYSFLNHYLPHDMATAYGRALLVLGVPPTIAMAAGVFEAVACMWRSRRLEPYLPIVVYGAWSVLAYVHLNVLAPYFSSVQARYLLPAIVPIAVCLALGAARAPRALRAVLALDVAVFVALVTAVFWFQTGRPMFGPAS